MAENPVRKLTEQDFELIAQASEEFQNQRYENCSQSLKQLQVIAGENPKLQHNIAIVDFYKSRAKDYRSLLKYLDEDIKKIEESEEKNKRTLSYYNKAVILYHLRRPHAALKVLDSFMEKLNAFDESIARRAGLLILALLLKTNQYEKAAKFLKYFQGQINMSSETPSVEESSSSETSSKNDDSKRMFKLLNILVNVVNESLIVIQDDESVEFTVLKAHQYYIGKDFQMAAKYLSKNFTAPTIKVEDYGEDQDTCLANNMGVIHLRVRHYAMALKFFQHALTFDNKTKLSLKEIPLHYISSSQKPEILYNMGIALLHLQRPKEAFECFLVPLKIYHNNPRLWLRAAEACIMVYESEVSKNEKKHIITNIAGSGVHRKYILAPSPKIYVSKNNVSVAIPSPTLEFACLCLRNADHMIKECAKILLSQSLPNYPESNKLDDFNYCNPSTPISGESFERLAAAIYTSYSYVSLRLGDYKIALEYGQRLLKIESITDAMAMLGRLYCAESLIMLNRVPEAVTYLDSKFITNLDSHHFETNDWQVNSVEAAQSVLRYNWAVTLVLQGEFELAKSILATCTHPVVFTKFKMLKMYIELANGNIDNCKIMARIDTPQFR